MNILTCSIFVIGLVNSFYCDKCVTKNFEILWYKSRGSLGDPNSGNIFDEDIKDVYKIQAVPNQEITVICENALIGYYKLYILRLDSNGIQKIQPGSFRNIKTLFELNLSQNNLEKINYGVFNGLHLGLLYLNNNKIDFIEHAAFSDMIKLKLIDLSFNRLKEIQIDWFVNTTNIVHLALHNNKIKSLNANIFRNIRPKNDTYASNFTINLDNNEINYIHPQAFDGVKKLGDVSLAGNKISTFVENIFSTLKHVRSLDLTHNQIVCLHDNYDFLLKVENTYLYNNPWNCTCLSDLKNWSVAHNVSVNINIDWSRCLLNKIITTINKL